MQFFRCLLRQLIIFCSYYRFLLCHLPFYCMNYVCDKHKLNCANRLVYLGLCQMKRHDTMIAIKVMHINRYAVSKFFRVPLINKCTNPNAELNETRTITTTTKLCPICFNAFYSFRLDSFVKQTLFHGSNQ